VRSNPHALLPGHLRPPALRFRRTLALAIVLGSVGAIDLTPTADAAVFWGDLHAHSALSFDGSNSPDAFFRIANEWEILKATAASFNVDGRFVAFSGNEWTHEWHMNVYFLGDDGPLCVNCTRPAT
jgi:hypothetical protein